VPADKGVGVGPSAILTTPTAQLIFAPLPTPGGGLHSVLACTCLCIRVPIPHFFWQKIPGLSRTIKTFYEDLLRAHQHL